MKHLQQGVDGTCSKEAGWLLEQYIYLVNLGVDLLVCTGGMSR